MSLRSGDLRGRIQQHIQLGEYREAEAVMRRALRQKPRDADILTELGLLLVHLQRLPEAVDCFAKAAAFDSRRADRHANLAAIRARNQDPEGAIAACRRALELDDRHVPALMSLARVSLGAGHVDEGLSACLRLMTIGADMAGEARSHVLEQAERATDRGDLGVANRLARALLALAPDDPAAWDRLGINEGHRQCFVRAISRFDKAVRLAPDQAHLRLNRAGARGFAGDATGALKDLEVAGALQPENWIAYANRAAMIDRGGDAASALASIRRATQIAPTNATAWCTQIALGLRLDDSAPDADARQFGEIAGKLVHRSQRGIARRGGGRMRVGYYSADFRAHSCAWFIEPLLAQHDRQRVEIFAYANVIAPDQVTNRLERLTDCWRSTVGMDDAELAARIAADGVDILVDLTGLFHGGRPLLFARKPARVQVNWLGFNATTGLTAIDWKLVDGHLAPLGMPLDWFAEGLWRLPRLSHCWRPPDDAPLPEFADRRPTFGSFNSLAKLSPRTVALWARLLGQVPGARLVLKAEHAAAPSVQARLRHAFQHHGVAPDRIEFLGYAASTRDHLAHYHEIDVALDPLPYNGTTTTCEALWMGVPVVTLPLPRLVARVGLSLAVAAGLDDLVATDDDDFIERAAGLIADRQRLRALRASLRACLVTSPLRDEIGFARAIEDAYEEIWAKASPATER